MNLLFIIIILLISQTIIFYLCFNRILFQRMLSKRLLSRKREIKVDKQIEARMLTKPLTRDNTLTGRLQKRLDKSYINLNSYAFLKMCVIICLLAFTLVYIVTGSPVIAFMFLLISPAAINYILNYLHKKRIASLSSHLPSIIDFISNSMKSGFSLIQAIQMVVDEGPPVIVIEFSRVLEDIRVGKSYDEAFDKFLARNPLKGIEILSAAIIISKETGGNLTYILDTVSSTIRERSKLEREIKSLTAQGRLSGIILISLPFVVFAFMWLLNPNYINTLFIEPVGKTLLFIGGSFQVIGIIMIKKIIKIDW